jgi:signal transduction histidine kinase
MSTITTSGTGPRTGVGCEPRSACSATSKTGRDVTLDVPPRRPGRPTGPKRRHVASGSLAAVLMLLLSLFFSFSTGRPASSVTTHEPLTPARRSLTELQSIHPFQGLMSPRSGIHAVVPASPERPFGQRRTTASAVPRARHAAAPIAAGIAARQAVPVATATALLGAALLVILFAGHLMRTGGRHVRPAAVKAGPAAAKAHPAMAKADPAMAKADPPADDAPGTRTADGTAEETIVLDRTFNIMSSSLQDTRDKLTRLVREQAALRRMATLVARGEPPATVFAAAAREVGDVLGADITRLLRYEADETTTVVGAWGGPDEVLPLGTRWSITGHNIPSMVLHRCAPARMDCFLGAVSPLCVFLRKHGILSGVGTPVGLEGKCCWGVMTAFSTRNQLLPREAETRICDFTDLVATAIANAQTHADLAASRARIVAATDQARRRIERDLHDGTQQRLVALVMDLHTAEQYVPADAPELRASLSAVAAGLTDALNDLRETARGIHPAILAEGGLTPAIAGLARRSAVPVELDADIGTRLPESVEVAAYYVVAESLANTAKYARASMAHVEAHVHDGQLHLSVWDDGVGGADPTHGSGLMGLVDRVEALNGTIDITSPTGHGTSLQVELPLVSAGAPLRPGDRTP